MPAMSLVPDPGGHQVSQEFPVPGDQDDLGLAFQDVLGLEDLEHGLGDLGILRDRLERAPTIWGRRAAALANSMAARRSAVLVMMLTWLAPSCLIALVT